MKYFVIGGAGFIGSHLVDRLVERGNVSVYDNLSNGNAAFLNDAHANRGYGFTLHKADVLNNQHLIQQMCGFSVVFHLAANPEARYGLANPRLDLEQGTICTWNALEAARRGGVNTFVFASSGTVYGEVAKSCGEQDLGSLPTSLYGASKLAGEALVSAYCECFGMKGYIFRFGNVVGPRATHGCILDFYKKLKASKGTTLEVLGDGTQSKPYLHVSDCVGAMLHVLDRNDADKIQIYNIAPNFGTSVQYIADCCVEFSPYPWAKIVYTGGDRGWAGDVPRSRMEALKLARAGYSLRYSSDEAVTKACIEIGDEVFGEEDT